MIDNEWGVMGSIQPKEANFDDLGTSNAALSSSGYIPENNSLINSLNKYKEFNKKILEQARVHFQKLDTENFLLKMQVKELLNLQDEERMLVSEVIQLMEEQNQLTYKQLELMRHKVRKIKELFKQIKIFDDEGNTALPIALFNLEIIKKIIDNTDTV